MNKAKILIVEDEAIIAMEIENQLESLGYEITSIADTGEKAIEDTEEDKPDLILMDIRIKGEMDGIETASRIQHKLDTPIIFLTAHAEEEKLERAKLTLPYGYLLKPVQDRDLMVTIEMALFASSINAERNQAREALKKANEELEQKVAERTKALLREIEERKQIEENLRIAKKGAESANQAKTEFLANISHELRNPMHQILSYSKFGDEKYVKITDEKRRHYFRQIRKSSDRLMVLLNNLLDLSKLESGKVDYQIKENDLVDVIDEAVKEFRQSLEEKQLTIELENRKASVFVCCDSYKIGQVVRNLLSNAIKFSSENHTIKINLANSRLEKDDNIVQTVKTSVIDQGIGIPGDELDRVFDKFSQSSKTKTGAGGTGLGLAICKEIIEAHKGQIWAENNPKNGVTFSFVLPVQQEGA